MKSAGNSRSVDEVLREERAEIARRRQARHPDGVEAPAGLLGLAISGGGIRSATFGLGVLESLREKGVLRAVDYLSTVSGGGYIGAWLSANCLRSAERAAKPHHHLDGSEAPRSCEGDAPAPADWLARDADWRASIAHLRRYSNYLSPRLGFFSADTWSMFTVWSRNMMLVQATVIFGIACLLLLPRLLYTPFVGWSAEGHWRWLSVLLYVGAVAGIAGNLMRLNQEKKLPFVLKADSPLSGGAAIAMLLLTAALIRYLDFEPFWNTPPDWWKAALIATLVVLSGFFLLPLGLRGVRCIYLHVLKEAHAPTQINYGQGWTQAVVVLPLLATGFLFSAVLWGQFNGPSPSHEMLALQSYSALLQNAWRYWPFPLAIAFMSLGLLSFAALFRSGQDWKSPRWYALFLLAVLLPMAGLHALLCAIVFLMQWCVVRYGTEQGGWLALVGGPTLILYAFSLCIVLQLGMLGRQARESVREWWSRLGAWLLIYGFAWLCVAVAAIYGPYWVAWLADNLGYLLSSLATWLGTTAGGLLAGRSAATHGRSDGRSQASGGRSKLLEVLAFVAPFVFILGLVLLVATLLQMLVVAAMGEVPHPAARLLAQHWIWLSAPAALAATCRVLAASATLLLLFALRVDINEFSLNAFYRSRLSRCYLGATRFLRGERKPQNFTGFDDGDDLKMSRLASTTQGDPACGLTAPLHLVNGALNLGGSRDLALHTRHCASFVLSPFVAGSSYASLAEDGCRKPLGYAPIAEYGGADGSPTLAQAISVSGAAASPNMGYHTSPVVAFLLTVFNVRLGWWFPNPYCSSCSHPSPWLSLRYLVQELFGGADDQSRYLMISDGGHFENLGVYELIRRNCAVIIASDAECDPERHFGGLGALIRMCEVDFGAIIDIKVGPLRPDEETRFSQAPFAVGEIRYRQDQEVRLGTLIYLKASMIATVDTAIRQYQSSHPCFPHESTGDQFYGEDQFESYRALGKAVANAALEGEAVIEALRPFVRGNS